MKDHPRTLLWRKKLDFILPNMPSAQVRLILTVWGGGWEGRKTGSGAGAGRQKGKGRITGQV